MGARQTAHDLDHTSPGLATVQADLAGREQHRVRYTCPDRQHGRRHFAAAPTVPIPDRVRKRDWPVIPTVLPPQPSVQVAYWLALPQIPDMHRAAMSSRNSSTATR